MDFTEKVAGSDQIFEKFKQWFVKKYVKNCWSWTKLRVSNWWRDFSLTVCHCTKIWWNFLVSFAQSCQNENFRCSQWWEFYPNDIFFYFSTLPSLLRSAHVSIILFTDLHVYEASSWGRDKWGLSCKFTSLATGRFQIKFRHIIFKLILVNGGWGIFYEIALGWMPQDLTNDKSILVQVMAWCRQNFTQDATQAPWSWWCLHQLWVGCSCYRKVSNISRTLDNKIVDHSDVGAAPTTSSFST